MDNQSHILLSTAYLPPVEYFARMAGAGAVLIEGEENYLKQTYRNRCEIYSANGKLPLVIPVIKASGNHTPVKEIKIDNAEPWQLSHWRAIVSAYNHSPFFIYYRDDFEGFYLKKFTSLFDFNYEILLVVLGLLKLNPKPGFTKTYLKADNSLLNDFRYSISPKKPTSLKPFPYQQVFGDRHGFLWNLSIIDLLFNTGPDAGIIVSSIAESHI
jgi:hypothetical protein